MEPNIDNVLKQVQKIQNLVDDRISQDRAYPSIDKILKGLDETLKAKKLLLHLVSQDLRQAQAFQKLLELSSELQNAYHFTTFSLPELPDSATPSPPKLILQSSSENRSSTVYELEDSKVQIVGRNPAVAQILLHDQLSLISGRHAELRYWEGNWQIRDLDSRNGTFINGNPQKLQDWYSLKATDQICLGSISQASGSATLVFEVPSTDAIHSAYTETQRVLDCNILCLIIPPQPLQATIQRLLQLAKDIQIAKLLIIVDRPGNLTVEALMDPLSEIRKSVKDQLQGVPFELIPLLLKPFTPSSGATIITPYAQPEFESLSKNLKVFCKERMEAVLTEWAFLKLNKVFNQIEEVLVEQDTTSKEQLQQDEAKLKELSQGKFKKQIDKIYKKVEGERDAFFRQAKCELNLSKTNLLDEHRQSSISYKIQQFVKQLQPQVSDRDGYRFVRLKVRKTEIGISSVNPVHIAATELCHKELMQWSTAEWQRISSEYVNGGLNALLKKSYELLNSVPDWTLPSDSFSISQTLSVQSILNISNVEPVIELRYKQPGLWGYIFKNLRGQIIAIGGTIMMLGSGFIPNDMVKSILIPSLIPFTFAIVWLSYNQDKEAKVEEITEKLQKETAIHYQSYVKGLIDRLTQRIMGLVDVEERRFRETLEDTREFYISYQAELDKMQSQLKSQLDAMKRPGENKVEKDLAELRRLKQSISS